MYYLMQTSNDYFPVFPRQPGACISIQLSVSLCKQLNFIIYSNIVLIIVKFYSCIIIRCMF